MNNGRIHLMDIGARGGFSWPFSDIKHNLVCYSVEPDPAEAARLERLYRQLQIEATILPVALWSEKRRLPMYMGKLAGVSSVFKPNYPLLEQFPEAERYRIVDTVEIETDSVANLVAAGKISRVDFIKIDVQGAELEILKGGHEFFRNNLVGIEAEVEFMELYQGQPLFGDIDRFVREELGLELWDLAKTYWKFNNSQVPFKPSKGKLAFGDALYLRPVERLGAWLSLMDKTLASEKLYALLEMTMLYGYFDYAQTLLTHADIEQYFEPAIRSSYSKRIRQISKKRYIKGKWGYAMYYILLGLANIFRPTQNGWGTRGTQLGSRKRRWFWY